VACGYRSSGWRLAALLSLSSAALAPGAAGAQESLPPAPVVPYVGPADPVPQTEPPAAGAIGLPLPFPIPIFPSPDSASTAPAPQASQEDE
jgi:hypothetical protein